MLTAKQALFVQEYLVDLNLTQAAIRAGYSANAARQTGSENLSKPVIADAIAREFAKRSARLEIDQDRVMLELGRIGFSDLRDLFTWNEEAATYVPSTELTVDQAAVVSSIEAVTTRTTDESGKTTTRVQLKIKTHDKLSALRELGRHLGIGIHIKHAGTIAAKVVMSDEEIVERWDHIVNRIAGRMASTKGDSD